MMPPGKLLARIEPWHIQNARFNRAWASNDEGLGLSGNGRGRHLQVNVRLSRNLWQQATVTAPALRFRGCRESPTE